MKSLRNEDVAACAAAAMKQNFSIAYNVFSSHVTESVIKCFAKPRGRGGTIKLTLINLMFPNRCVRKYKSMCIFFW